MAVDHLEEGMPLVDVVCSPCLLVVQSDMNLALLRGELGQRAPRLVLERQRILEGSVDLEVVMSSSRMWWLGGGASLYCRSRLQLSNIRFLHCRLVSQFWWSSLRVGLLLLLLVSFIYRPPAVSEVERRVHAELV